LAWQHDESFAALPLPFGECTGRWERYIAGHPNKWGAAVNRIFASIKSGTVVRLNRPSPDTVPVPQDIVLTNFQAQLATCFVKCLICPEVVEKGIRFFRHLVRIHQYRQRDRFFADASGRCPDCGLQFSSRVSLLAHFVGCKSHGTACSRQLWLSDLPRLTNGQLAHLDKQDAGRKQKLKKRGRASKTIDRPVHRAGGSGWVWRAGPIQEVRPIPVLQL